MNSSSRSKNDQTAMDILTAAVEGGINYWAACSNIRRDSAGMDVISVTLHSDSHESGEPDFEPKEVTISMVKAALRRLAFTEVKHGEGYQEVARQLVFEGSEYADFDAGTADAVVQVALFGEVVYG